MTIEVTDAGRNEYEALVRDAKRWRQEGARLQEIAAAMLPVMEAMRPLVLNLERLKDAAMEAAK